MALDRFAVVRRVPPSRWATVVAALLDGVSLVIAEVPRGIGAADARRLVARAADATRSSWCARRRVGGRPAPRSRSRAESSVWVGLDDAGFLTEPLAARARRGARRGRAAARSASWLRAV